MRINEKKIVSKDEKDVLLEEGGVLLNEIYEFNLNVIPSAVGDFQILFPAAMAMSGFEDWKGMAKALEHDLNNAIKDYAKPGIKKIVSVDVLSKHFSGVANEYSMDGVPFIVPKLFLKGELKDIHRDLFNIYKDEIQKVLDKDNIINYTVDDDYEPTLKDDYAA